MKISTTYFYAPPEDFRKGEVVLPENESAHLAKSLRAKVGDEIIVVDGEGKAFAVEILKIDGKRAKGTILGEVEHAPEPLIKHAIGIGTIQPARLETAWDMCVQLGISRLIPLWTDFSIDRMKPDGRFIERLKSISIRAMKQSRRAFLPVVEPPQTLVELINSKKFDYIFFGDPEGLPDFPQKKPRLGENVLLIIGPEGGFSSEEKRIISDAGGIAISLGRRRLRTETATVALSLLSLRWTEDI